MFKTLLLFIWLLIFSLQVFSQNKEERVKQLLDYAYENHEIEALKSADSLKLALEYSLKMGDTEFTVYLLRTISYHYSSNLYNYEESYKYLEEIRGIAESSPENKKFLCYYHSGKGILYFLENTRLDSAFEEFRKSYEMLEANDLSSRHIIYNNYALFFIDRELADSALIYLEKAKLSYINNQKFYFDKTFLFKNNINMAVCYMYKNNADSVYHYLFNAIEFAQKNNFYSKVYEGFIYLSTYFINNGKMTKGLENLEKAKSFFNHSNSFYHKMLYFKNLSIVFYTQGNFKKAFEYLNEEMLYKDSINERGLSNKVAMLENNIEIKKMTYEINLKELNYQLQRDRLKNIIVTSFFIFIIAFLSFAFYLFYLKKKRRMQEIKAINEALVQESEKQKIEIELLKKEEELLKANLELSYEKNNLSEIKENLQTVVEHSMDPEFDNIRPILKKIKSSESKLKTIQKINQSVSFSNNKFYNTLKKEHPLLTNNEMKFAMLLKLNISTEELCKIYNISKSSLNTKRYRLRKKLNLNNEQSLEDYIMAIDESVNN
jgi:DNA-binding CsgD family transcriptional regulator